MNTTKKTYLLIIILIIVGGIWINNDLRKLRNVPSSNIKIGWQSTWATQGQLTEVLKNTDVLKKHNLSAEFQGFESGAPLNEAAMVKAVDVIFTADQPAATLLSKNPNWTIIGRLMYNRVSLYTPPKSTIANISDLKGKTVAMPFGAAAQRMALKAESDAGLDPKKDVKNINLSINEQSDLVKDKEATKWGSIDAMAGFDPTPAIFQEKGLIKLLKEEKVVSVIVMSNEYIGKNPDAPANFLKAFRDAYDYYRLNPSQANQWFIDDSKLNITPSALEISAQIEPNLQAKNKADIRLAFNDDDYRIMQEAADFILNQGLVKNKVTMKNYVNTIYLDKAFK